MILTGKEIEDYFKTIDLVESLLLEFVYYEKKKELVLVLDVPGDYSDDDKTNFPEYEKVWIKIRFKDIIGYKRIKGTDELMHEKLNNYLLKRDRRNKVIHFLEIIYKGNSCVIEIDFGDFGIAKLEFTTLSVSILYGKAEKDPPGWRYVNALSGKRIDYYDPFRKNSGHKIN